jgi:virulence-associated protein VapD
MFAISFDMVISNLKAYYGEPYNRACFEIKVLNSKLNIKHCHGN